jgi:hypothetical protein
VRDIHGQRTIIPLKFYAVASRIWRKVSMNGQVPNGRHGHAYATIGTIFVIFGGDDGKQAYNDLWILDLSTCT